MTNNKEITLLNTLGALRNSGYAPKKIKDELRDNLIEKLKRREQVFKGIIGYEHTVIPEVERAILSRHNINLLGLRGQAKTSIARAMVNLLDEYIPAIEGSELNDNPFEPLSASAKDLIAKHGENTPIKWIHRSERYTEKLATPDVTVADLIGDIDPIKAANLKLSYADERVIHFGLVPHANRGIFVINELPDLQARIQVSLFNILQEGDIQIRGFNIRLPLDIFFMFTANPEDYTNRGAIITPLKDRIQSQIITHYPKSIDISKSITMQEARILPDQKAKVLVNPILENILEHIAFEARESEFIDQKSGVSARLSITAYEALISTCERRSILSGDAKTIARIGDLYGVIPAITGKVELVYEGEQEGAANVAHHLISKSIRKYFAENFPNPEQLKKRKLENPFTPIVAWFDANELDLFHDETDEKFYSKLEKVSGLKSLVEKYHPNLNQHETRFMMEFVLNGLAEFSLLSKSILEIGFNFKDIMNSVFSSRNFDFEDEN